MNVVMLGRTGSEPRSSRCRAPPRAARSPAPSSTRCSAWPRAGSTEIIDLQAELVAEPPVPVRRSADVDAPLPALVCASANPDKVAEIAAILGDVVELLPRPADVPDVVEDADTLEGNARLKAVAICAATGMAGGRRRHRARGRRARRRARRVRRRATPARTRPTPTTAPSCSARWLTVADGPGRSAAFRTVALVRWPDGDELVVEGVCDGHDRRRAAAPGVASATTRCSSPTTATAGRSAR